MVVTKKCNILILAHALIVYVCWVNVFPDGYVFAGGDVVQLIDQERTLQTMKYLWGDLTIGEGTFVNYYAYLPFYSILYSLANLFSLTPSEHSFLYYLFFILGSFWSFYYSIPCFIKSYSFCSNHYRIIFSLLYALNHYVFYNFYFIWGYTPFLSLYVLLPLLFGTIFSYLNTSNKKIVSWYLLRINIVFLLLNIPSGNLSFLVATGLAIIFYVVLLLLGKEITAFKILYPKAIAIFMSLFIATSWSWLAQIFGTLELVESAESVFELPAWIVWQSVKFPYVFYITKDLSMFKGLYPYAFLYIVLSISAVYFCVGSKRRVRKIPFLVMLLVYILLSNKLIGIIDHSIITKIFTSSILLSCLRSYEKTIIFLPYFAVMMIVLGYDRKVKSHRIVVFLTCFCVVLSIYPMLTGSMQQNYSAAYKQGETLESSDISFLVKIPSEYHDFADKIDNSDLLFRYFDMPYSVVNSPGWQNFDKWKLVGHNPVKQFFNHPFIDMNSYFFSGIGNYGLRWNKQSPSDSTWIFTLAQNYNVKYFVYHLDARKEFIDKTLSKIRYYESQNLISKIMSNDKFMIYEIADNLFLPRIFIPGDVVCVDSKHKENLLEDIVGDPRNNSNQGKAIFASSTQELHLNSSFQHDPPIVEFRRVNPSKYKLKISGIRKIFPVILSERFNPFWKIYPVLPMCESVNSNNINNNVNFKSLNIKGTIQNNNISPGSFWDTIWEKPLPSRYHQKVNFNANSWIVDPLYLKTHYPEYIVENHDGSFDVDFIVEFSLQKLWLLGIILVTTWIICLSLIVFFKDKKYSLNS